MELDIVWCDVALRVVVWHYVVWCGVACRGVEKVDASNGKIRRKMRRMRR